MNQEEVINKTIRDLKKFELIHPVDSGEIRPFLERVYAAGFNHGCSYTNLRHGGYKEYIIEQQDSQHRLINTYPTSRKAAKEVHCDHKTILNHIKSGTKTKKGHYWKYKDRESIN